MVSTPFPQAFAGILRQPVTIAWVASLAIHGLLGASLPSITTEPKPETQRTVKLIELTPAEQSRLPILSSPQPSNVSPQIPYFPPGSSTPIPGSSTPIPGTPTIPFSTPPVVPWTWNYPSRTGLPSSMPPIRQTPPRSNQAPNKIATGKVEVKKFPGGDSNQDFRVAETTRFGGLGGQQDFQGQNPPASPPLSRTRPEKISQTAIEQLRKLQQQKRAALQGDSSTGNTNPGNTNPGNTNPGNTNPGNANAGGPSGATTQQAQAAANLGSWITKHNVQLSGLETIGLAPTENPQNLKGDAIVAVWIDAEGKVNYPEIIQPSNNETLDKAALEIASRYSFPKGSTGKVFMVVVKFGEPSKPANSAQQKES